MDDLETALHRAADLIAAYRRDAPDTRVGPAATRDEVAAALDPDLPDGPVPLAHVVDELVAGAEPGLVCTPGPRYFGFVVGGSVDAAVVADLLATGWDQNAFNAALSPAAMAFEDVAGRWLKELLRIPASASVGFVTGAGAANTVGLAAGRSHVLAAKAGMPAATASPARPGCGSSPEPSGTQPSTGRCACSASATGPSRRYRPSQTARWIRARSRRRWPPRRMCRRSSARRRAT